MFIASQVVYCCNTIQATDWSFYLISKPVRSNQIITMNYPISSVAKAVTSVKKYEHEGSSNQEEYGAKKLNKRMSEKKGKLRAHQLTKHKRLAIGSRCKVSKWCSTRKDLWVRWMEIKNMR